MPEVIDKVTTSLEGISRDELRTFWSVLHKMESNLALMAKDGTIID
jgi:MarR family transcriptional regulator for hemolysin